MMEANRSTWTQMSDMYNEVWSKRDLRVEGWPMMSSPLPTLLICVTYIFIVKIAGPRFMKDREPYNCQSFLFFYNAFQVILSTYIFVQLLRAGWLSDYSYLCQPVDYSTSPQALLMLHCCYCYYISKFTEFIDTFCFVARKKYNQVSLLHVIHHSIMPLSTWPGMRFMPGGHASFFALLNTFVHIFMYLYYFLAALGPTYQKWIWWKPHMTKMQLVQFVCVMIHGFQLIFLEDCGFPWQFAYYIAAHAVMFFVLFTQFYIRHYVLPRKGFKAQLKSPQDEVLHTNYKAKAA